MERGPQKTPGEPRPAEKFDRDRYAGTAGQYAVIAAIVLLIAFAAVSLH